MLIHVFLILAVVGIIAMIVAIVLDSLAFSCVSVLSWIATFIGSFNLEYPYLYVSHGQTNVGFHSVNGGLTTSVVLFLMILVSIYLVAYYASLDRSINP